jgi:uncharacterized protein YndB with AHSA1/START domain
MTEPTAEPSSDPTASEPGTIHVDQFIAHPPAKVWRALTEPDLVAQWWGPGDIRPEIGHRFTVDMGPWGKARCRVLAVEPGKAFAYTFGEGELDTTIRWRLESEGIGTRLFLEHSGFDLDSPVGRSAFEGMGGGWSTMVLPRMESVLDAV